MAFNITELTGSISAEGIQKSSSFAASIVMPPSLSSTPIMDQLPFRINSANLPGFQIQTDDIRQKGYGLTEKRPFQVGYDDITLTIIADGNGKVLQVS